MKAIIAIVLLVVGSGAACAHITSSPDNAPSNSHFIAHFTVPHGCGGSPTVAVRIKIPDGLSEVKPEHKPGWTITQKRYKFAGPPPQTLGAPEEIEWRGGPLPDDEYDSFGITMLLPPNQKTLYFPTIQTCQKGENRWVNIPAQGQQWHDVKEPAPFVRVTVPTQ
jgi:uncharacterized protein YcnI